jgi:uncharacterized protein
VRGQFQVVDTHQHYGAVGDALSGMEAADGRSASDYEAEDLRRRIEVLDENGVDRTVVIASHGYLRPHGIADTQSVNDGLISYRRRAPDRIAAVVGVVEPLYGDVGLPEIDRCRELGMAGISFHGRFQGVSHDSPWVQRYVERIGQLGMTPFVHCAVGSPEEALWKAEGLALDFPDVRFVVLDALSRFEDCRAALLAAQRSPNLVFDTALTLDFRYIVPLVREFGAERILYGSDLYSRSVRPPGADVLGQILGSDLEDADKAAILSGNAKRLLGLE